jgi:hypothetical protein
MRDEDEFGTYEWTKRTSGVMSAAEHGRMLAAIACAQPGYVAGLVRRAAGWTSRRGASLSLTLPEPPRGPLVEAAHQACEQQGPHVKWHSYRTWAYGHALALFDGKSLDRKLFYLACLLHDYGLEQPHGREDFTLRSAERALECVRGLDLSEDAVRAVADAITLHVTPGIRLKRDGALGYYLQAGSLLDLAGVRAWQLPQAYHDAAATEYPRDGVTDSFVSLVRAEADANPGSRFSLLYRCGLTLTFRLDRRVTAWRTSRGRS